MMQRLSKLLFIGVIFSLPAQADIRVLLRFDISGHHVQRVVSITAPESFKSEMTSTAGSLRSIPEVQAPLSPIASGRSAAQADTLTQSGLTLTPDRTGFAQLTWFDERGVQISETTVPDPRVTRSPMHIDGAESSGLALVSGAWLATGPDLARSLTIRLVADLASGLGAESWQVLLPAVE